MYKNKIGFRTGPFATFQYSKNQYQYTGQYAPNNDFDRGRTYGGGVLLDLVYFPAKRLSLAAGIATLSYNHNDDKQQNYHQKSDNFGLNVNDNELTLTAAYAFGK